MLNVTSWEVLTFLCVLVLSLSHLFVGRIKIINKNQDILVAFAGGIGISYVFLTILPKLAKADKLFFTTDDIGFLLFLEHNAYLLALLGLLKGML